MLIAAALALSVVACGPSAEVRAAQDAEKQLALVKSSGGSQQEICDAERDVAAAWLKALDKEKYRIADLSADIACRLASQRHY